VGSVKRCAPIYHHGSERCVAKSSPVHEAHILFGLLVVFVLAIVPFSYVSIRQLGQTRLLQPAPKESHPGPHRIANLHNPWATRFRFEWIGGFEVRGLDRRFVAAWRHAEQPVFLQLQLIKGATHYELLSVFNREQTLTTTSLNGLVPPTPPGSFVQRFPDATLTELFRQHTAAHDFLLAGGHVKLESHGVRFDRALIEVLSRTHAFVTSLSAWPLRSVSWVLVGPRRARNRSVAEQLDFAGTTPTEVEAREAEARALAEATRPPTGATSTRKEGAPARSNDAQDDEGGQLDDATVAEVEALLAKASPGRRASPEPRVRRPTPAARKAVTGVAGAPGPPARPTPGGPTPRAGRTR
jgi:hypothetical protein